MNLSDPASEFEVKTTTSALKNYFRKLSEPILTFKLHQKLISAAKLESREKRIEEIGNIIRQLPRDNYRLAKLIIGHLKNVAAESSRNMMSISNLAVCFGPTLLRPEEETMAAIMDIKFCNLVVEILIENYDTIFDSKGSPATNGLSTETVHLRAQANKSTSQSYSEDSTYGVEPKVQNFTRPDLYASKSQARVTSRLNANMSPVKKPEYSNKPPMYANIAQNNHNNVGSSSDSSVAMRGAMSKSYGGGPPSSSAHSGQQMSSVPGPGAPLINRRVRTLYACDAENDSELSFEPNEIIYNVRESREPGWLEGTLGGKTGLIPANYIEYV